MKKIMLVLAVLVMTISCGSQVRSYEYMAGELVPCYVNKVGPLNDTRETHRYFDLPFCSGNGQEKKQTVGEFLNGDHLVTSIYRLIFRSPEKSKIACRKKLKSEQVSVFRAAVSRDYYFQMKCDELNIQDSIGFLDKSSDNDKYFIYNHISFDIYYHKGHVIEIKTGMGHEEAVELIEDSEVDIEFIYSVTWKETDAPFQERTKSYFEHFVLSIDHLKVHRFITSCVSLTLLVLIGCLLTLSLHKKHLQNDSIKDEEWSCEEEKGWRNLHSDVFRFPNHMSIFSAILGSGIQSLIIIIIVLILGVAGVFYPYTSDQFTALLVIYFVTSFVAGYVATTFYHLLGGEICVENVALTRNLFGGSMLTQFCFLSIIASCNKSVLPVSIYVVMVIVFYRLLGPMPLIEVGGVWGNVVKWECRAPCGTSKCPKEVWGQAWYRAALPQMAMAGLLPFSLIFTHLNHLLAKHDWEWDHQIYPTHLLVFILLLILTALVTVAFTYSQLSAGDHQWWWRSFICGGSSGLYIYLYGMYYYNTASESEMPGLMHTLSIFVPMALGCFLVMGTIGFLASIVFVIHLYKSMTFD